MKIIYIQSRLSFLFFALLFQLTRTLASPTDELILAGRKTGDTAVEDNTASNYSKERGYECGNTFFTDHEVEEALREGVQRFDMELDMEKYHGALYSDSESSEYLLFSFKKKDRSLSPNKYKQCSAFVVFKSDEKKVIDVITRISNNSFTKCIKRNGPQIELSTSVLEHTNGYQCAHEFFSDQVIQDSYQLAKSKIGKNTKYPAPYYGNLFPENSGILIWPIFSRRSIHTSGNGDAGPYNIVLSKDGEFIDVVVRGYLQNLLRCARSRKTTAPRSDPLPQSFVPAPKVGFQCGKIFFDIDSLNLAAETAKMVFPKKKNALFPSPYNGHLFNEPCWLWPIFKNRMLFSRARAGPFRVVLTLDFKVMSAVIVNKDNEMTVCEHKMLKGKKSHDTGDYLCNKKLFTNAQLVNAAEVGCDRITTEISKNSRFFPARYEGPRFEKDGPYLTYPIFLNGRTYEGGPKRPGCYRVVMTPACEVVGALFLIKKGGTIEKIVKCQKIKDNIPIEAFPYNPKEPISEHKSLY